MGNMSLAYWQSQLGKVDPHVTRLEYKITGAKVMAPIVANSVALTTFDGLTSQSQIDDHLGTTNEFLLSALNAGVMAGDMVAFVVDLSGQAKQLTKVSYQIYSGAGGTTKAEGCVQASSALTAGSITEAAVGANGNVAVKILSTGVDALTSATLVVELCWISK